MGCDGEDYRQGIERALDTRRESLASAPTEATAADLAGWLVGLSSPHQRLVVNNLPAARRPEVLHRLVKEADRQVGNSPGRLVGFASAAVVVAGALETRCFPRAFVYDRRAEAWSRLGNARRILGDLPGADLAFSRARHEAVSGTREPLLVGKLLSYGSSLRRDQRRFGEAIHLARRAERLYGHLGERHLELHAAISLGSAFFQAGEAATALEQLYRTADRLEPAAQSDLALCWLHNFVDCHIEMGRPHQALAVHEHLEPVYSAAGDNRALSGRWARARLLCALGCAREGAEVLEVVRAALLDRGMVYDAAIAGLHLARIWTRLGERKRARYLLAEVLPVFTSLGIQREAREARRLLAQAGY